MGLSYPKKVVWALQSSLGKFPWCQTTRQGVQSNRHGWGASLLTLEKGGQMYSRLSSQPCCLPA